MSSTTIGLILQLLGWLLDRFNANAATKKAYLDLIEKAKDDPAISLTLKRQSEDMEKDLKGGGGE